MYYMSSTIVLDAASGVPFYRQIIRQVEMAILDGRLVPGDRLPTIRSLAITLKINPNTIAKAYAELELRGFVSTQVGSGTFVSDKRPPPDEGERESRIEGVVVRCIRELESLGVLRTAIPDVVREYLE